MIKRETLQFLRELKANNNKDWFGAHKDQYHAAMANFKGFITELIVGVDDFDHHLEGLTAEECIFRIYRDARFAEELGPYKTHFGAYIAFGGRNSEYAGYYIHIAPDNCYVGGGMYSPGIAVRRKLRQEIDYNPKPFRAILKGEGFCKYYEEIQGETLNSAPKGYPKDHPDIDLLKLQSYFAIHEMEEETFVKEDAVNTVLNRLSHLYNFNRFLNETFVS